MAIQRILKSIILLASIALGACQTEAYYGVYIGDFLPQSNKVKGDVYAVDPNTLFIKGFSYDGLSSDAVFWAGSSEFPDRTGFHIPNDISQYNPIPASEKQNFILHLPGKISVQSMKWLAVWDRDQSKSMGSLIFLSPLRPPQPMAIGKLFFTRPGTSTGDILITDMQTIIIQNFNFVGGSKDSYFMLSKGMKPNGDGIRLQEDGRISPLVPRTNYTLKLTLPDGHHIEDYDILSIWSENTNSHNGFIDVPRNLHVPPSLRSLQSREPKMANFNCEMLNDNLGLEVRWFIDGDDIIIQLVGNIAASEYMALGLSKDDTYSRFDSADAIVTGVDKDGKGFAVDYYFQGDKKCTEGQGMCPDTSYGAQDNLQLLKVERVQTDNKEDFTIVKVKRHLKTEDNVYDQVIYTDGPQAILWAVGPMDSNGMAGSPTLQSRGNLLLDFGRDAMWNCPAEIRVKENREYPHEPKVRLKELADRIHCPADHLFRAQLGVAPYNSSEKVWYINGIPKPELVIERGISYTFIIEGGLTSPNHHPFYITNSPSGGLYKNILEANEEIEITYAGIEKDEVTDVIFPTAEGRLCFWSESDADPKFAVVTARRSDVIPLVLNCEPGKPGKLIWTPTGETPNEVYYQSYTERNLGGKIRVVDFCEETKPHRYLEIYPIKGGKPNIHLKTESSVRESESKEFESLISAVKLDFSNDENTKKVERMPEEAAPEFIQEKYSLKNDQHNIYNNIIMSSGISSDRLTERYDVVEKQQALENETGSTYLQKTESSDEIFPHDESERSDKYISNLKNSRKSSNQINTALVSHTNSEDLSVKYPSHSTSETSSHSVLGKHFSQEFKPQFEGGFIPLVTNPMKEKESAQKKEFVLPSHHQNRPHRPFLYNESVPFHGTFKPGVPDFSGFNISNYSKEDASIIVSSVAQDNLALLSAPRPQTIPRNFPPVGAIQLHLLDRPADIRHRPQRVQSFGPRFQSLQQQQPLDEMRKNAFPNLPVNRKTNFPIPNIRGEDLASVPSQRVYVSMQTIGDKKPSLPNVPNLPVSSGYNQNVQNPHQIKNMFAPTIQRRPDFYDEKRVNLRHPNEALRKFNAPQGFPQINNKQINQQNGKVSLVQSGMMPPQVNNRPNIPNAPMNTFQGSSERNINSQGPLRIPYPLTNMPQRERGPHNSLLLKPFQIRSNPLLFEKSNMHSGHFNHPQIPGLMLPVSSHTLNQNDKSVEAFKGPIITESNSQKEHKLFHYLESEESAEEPNKNISPAFTKDESNKNHEIPLQKLPFNETLGAFVLSTNLKSPESFPSVNFQENETLDTHLDDYESFNAKDDVPSRLNIAENNPSKSDVPLRISQNFGENRPQIIIEKKDMKYNEPSEFNNHPTSFLNPEGDKYAVKSQAFKDFSSSKDSQEIPDAYFEYEHEDHHDDGASIITDDDYLPSNVPFGARLKFPQNGSRVPVKSINETPKIPSVINRKPHIPLVNNANLNSGKFAKSVIPTTSTESPTRPSTVAPNIVSTTTDATLIAMESAESNLFNEKQMISKEKEEQEKNLYYEPPFSTLHVNYQTSILPTQDTKSSNEMKHIPIIADELEDIGETGYIGRKNVLNNNNSNSSFPSLVVPPKISEDINLPQISDNPPTHDNRTDYSILNHVLTLIGGPPDN